jgi:hypothetical protein
VTAPSDANDLDSQTTVSAFFDNKSVFGAFANQPLERPFGSKSERPAAVGKARGANRKRNVPGGRSPKRQTLSRLVQSNDAVVVYDGQECVGTIIKFDGQYDAFDARGRCLGSFRKRADAMRAFPSRGERQPAGDATKEEPTTA